MVAQKRSSAIKRIKILFLPRRHKDKKKRKSLAQLGVFPSNYEYSFDKFQSKADQVYRIVLNYNKAGDETYSATIQLSNAYLQAALKAIEKVYASQFPDTIFQYQFFGSNHK